MNARRRGVEQVIDEEDEEYRGDDRDDRDDSLTKNKENRPSSAFEVTYLRLEHNLSNKQKPFLP